MRDYFYSEFRKQLGLMSYLPVPRYLSEMFKLGGVPFFGGPEWENAEEDLSPIPMADRPQFILSLFMIVLTDQALFTNNSNAYEEWRRQTGFPKFGWFGSGIHNENPFKLLSVPEKEGLVDVDKMIAMMPEFVDFLIAESTQVLVADGMLPDIESHFRGILNDPSFSTAEGEVAAAFKAALEERLPHLID